VKVAIETRITTTTDCPILLTRKRVT
jgi:hypothetical protein